MTAIVLNYSTNLLESLLRSLRTFFVAIATGWMEGRQKSANARVAHYLARIEFNQGDEALIRHRLDQGRSISEIAEELK